MARTPTGSCAAGIGPLARGLALLLMLTSAAPLATAQTAPGGSTSRPPVPRAAAPIDLTGYWVAIVTEDWRWRMVTPAKGDYASIPLTPEGKRVADTWDPARDETNGEQCRSYGAPALMRAPTRLHVTWHDDRTLKVESDYGTQTRLLEFGPRSAARRTGRPTWQGESAAEWVLPAGRPAGAAAAPGQAPRVGMLKTITTRLRPGYLRKNGVPYSADTVLTEYWSVHEVSSTTKYLVVTIKVDDPTNLQLPWVTAMHFRLEPDGNKWDPTLCSARW